MKSIRTDSDSRCNAHNNVPNYPAKTNSAMAENSERARLAEIISKQIFGTFGWKLSGPKNQDFDCIQQKLHQKVRGRGEHPTDCVFTYTDPRTGQRVYLNTDLKSFGKTTISGLSLGPILKSLGRGTECARLSEQWKSMFGIDTSQSNRIEGLLFIYNHDGEVRDEFIPKLDSLVPSAMGLATLPLLYVIGPERSLYLYTVADDIRRQHGVTTSDQRSFWFYFPHLKRTRTLYNYSECVPIDHLLSPLIVARGKETSDDMLDFHAYYDGAGSSPEEFEYVIDSLFRYQIATNKTNINIVLSLPDSKAAVHFHTARDRYARDKWHTISPNQELSQQMVSKITFRSMPSQIARLSEIEIGLDIR